MKPHQVTFTRDQYGRRIASVAISNRPGQVCRILETDYHRVTAALGNGPWFANGAKGYEYVRARDPLAKRPAMVARLVTGEIKRTFVHYRNGDRFDLTRPNLDVVGGSGGCRKSPKRKLEKARTAASVSEAPMHGL